MARFSNTADLIGIGRSDDRDVIRSINSDCDRLVGIGTLIIRDPCVKGFGDSLAFN